MRIQKIIKIKILLIINNKFSSLHGINEHLISNNRLMEIVLIVRIVIVMLMKLLFSLII